MISLRTAERLLDFGARIGRGQRAREQLEGAVALHNILEECGVAYLADEVGMGKTYVALGAMALFRHFQPDFRVLVIAPRENIQMKWMKELGNFVSYNVRFPDLRVKAIDGRPVRSLVACENLVSFVREATLNPDRDFFVRLSSFSLPVTGRDAVDPDAARRLRDGLRSGIPWLADEVFNLRNKQAFKDSVARAVCCALPRFDLVIVDEGHNLKHGVKESSAARNRVLALAMGRGASSDTRLFPGFGPRAARVLFLSATPVEESYTHLWNQLEVFARGKDYSELNRADVDEEQKKAAARRFLIRRVTAIRVGETEYTKNLYRREWRRGGVRAFDEPIRAEDPKQRLVVALVQKKVSELLGHERFKRSFQIGMLASFESFLETTRLKRDGADTGTFDDAEQTEDLLEREGIDVADVNRLSRSYRERFGTEMPHPKMDALVEVLSGNWRSGRKSLVFVRRVASVKELKRKLDEKYDAWLIERLRRELPHGVQPRLQRIYEQYLAERSPVPPSVVNSEGQAMAGAPDDIQDQGGTDTFFAWFFRGEGPRGVVSGANVQQRFIQRGASYATFFEDNYVADLLECRPGQVAGRLAAALGLDEAVLRAVLRERSKRFLSRARKRASADRFEAVQAAAIELLKDSAGPRQDAARILWHERFESSLVHLHASEAPDIGDWLETPTFFSRLRHRAALRDRLWPQSNVDDPLQAFRERELRRQLLASAARLGHAFIDLYVMAIRRLGSMDLRAMEPSTSADSASVADPIDAYLDILETQMRTPIGDRGWRAFDELGEVAAHFDLLLDVNAPDARKQPLAETARSFGQLLRQQQPVGGMYGQLNQTLVRQFRMPGYPLVLVTTDLLQEGEDLHTFCSEVHHYGIAWTPSSMEQRTGRIDRVRSHTERRLGPMKVSTIRGEDLLQVHFPHLQYTVEVLQVDRVLARMNEFLRLMHEGLIVRAGDEKSIDTTKEMVRDRRQVEPIREPLRTAFPIGPGLLAGDARPLAVTEAFARGLTRRFARIATATLPGLDIAWEPRMESGVLHGTARLGSRIQPFTLLLRSIGSRAAVRCISPVGCVRPDDDQERIVASASRRVARIGAIPTETERTYDLTVEDEVLLAEDPGYDLARIALLVRRVVAEADILEQRHLPGHDEVLATFMEDLQKESQRGR